ncbi:MAG: hypothetical protein MJ132_06160 [Clostridia bacterium]|nr:hypothetical protein [Clostridia bacterium]
MKKAKKLLSLVVAVCLVYSMTIGAVITTKATSEGFEADIMDIDFSKGNDNNVKAANSPKLIADTGATVSVVPDLVLGRKVATFDGKSGFGYNLPAETVTAISKNGYTIELMLKVTGSSSAYAFGDCANIAGMGLELNSNHSITYYQKNTSNPNYRQCWYDEGDAKGYTPNKWMHITLICDTQKGHTEMYVDGKSFDYSNQNASYVLQFPTTGAQTLFIGGNSKLGTFSEGMKGSIAYFKMYSKVLTATQVKEIYEDQKETQADILCVDYSSGKADELVENGPAIVSTSGQTVKYSKDSSLQRNVAVFDGTSGLGYTFAESDYEKMKNGYTFEALISLSELPATTNEYGSSVIGCMNEGKGFGLMGTAGNSLQYWIGKDAGADGNYRQLWLKGSSSTIVPISKWLHIVVTYENGTYYYYVNGEQQDSVTPSEFGYLSAPANVLYVGGAPDSDGSFRAGMKGSVSFVKMYSSAKTASQVGAMSENALAAGSSNQVESTAPAGTINTKNSKGEAFEGTFDKNNVIINFAAMSDTHIMTGTSTHDTKFINALKLAKQLSGGADKLDGVLVAGDIGDSAPLQEYVRVKQFLDDNLSSHTEYLPTIGNHDYYFDGAFSGRNSFLNIITKDWVYRNPIDGNTEAEIIHGNYHTVINGIHFISVFGMDGSHAEGDVQWLDRQLKKAEQDTPEMPIVVYSHVQAVNTVIDDEDDPSESRWYSTTIGSTLEKYPNVVYFAGHTHATPDIWRNGGYVAVGTGCIEKCSMQVQIDNAGNVQIGVYKTTTESTLNTTPESVWTFETKKFEGSVSSDPDDVTPDDDDDGEKHFNTTGIDENATQNGNENSDGGNATSPLTGENLPYTILAAVCLLAGIGLASFKSAFCH